MAQIFALAGVRYEEEVDCVTGGTDSTGMTPGQNQGEGMIKFDRPTLEMFGAGSGIRSGTNHVVQSDILAQFC